MARIQVGRDGDLGAVAFPAGVVFPVEMAEAPVEVLYFETVEQFQAAKKQFQVDQILAKLTPEEVILLKEAFSVPAA